MWTLMSSVFKLAMRGPPRYGSLRWREMLYSGSRINVIWSSAQVGAFLTQRKYAYMHLPLLIGLWTRRREGDVLRMKWADYDCQTIKVKQRKGRRRRKQGSASIVVIPVEGGTGRRARGPHGGQLTTAMAAPLADYLPDVALARHQSADPAFASPSTTKLTLYALRACTPRIQQEVAAPLRQWMPLMILTQSARRGVAGLRARV
jgi:integrase